MEGKESTKELDILFLNRHVFFFFFASFTFVLILFNEFLCPHSVYIPLSKSSPQIASSALNTHYFVVQLVFSSLGTKSTISFIKKRTKYTCFASTFNLGHLQSSSLFSDMFKHLNLHIR